MFLLKLAPVATSLFIEVYATSFLIFEGYASVSDKSLSWISYSILLSVMLAFRTWHFYMWEGRSYLFLKRFDPAHPRHYSVHVTALVLVANYRGHVIFIDLLPATLIFALHIAKAALP